MTRTQLISRDEESSAPIIHKLVRRISRVKSHNPNIRIPEGSGRDRFVKIIQICVKFLRIARNRAIHKNHKIGKPVKGRQNSRQCLIPRLTEQDRHLIFAPCRFGIRARRQVVKVRVGFFERVCRPRAYLF
jgi:hypothetical protein